MSTALIDYNMGNLGSVAKALEFVGASARVVASGQELRGFDCCILPGVGNFGDGMENLRQRGFRFRRISARHLPRDADAV